MNPFTHSTLAVALPAMRRGPQRRPLGLCRRGITLAAGRLALAAGLGMAALPAQALDLNTATAVQLETIRGLGSKTVDIIIKERERGGNFTSLDDLVERVRGIGQKKAQALQAAGLEVATPVQAPAGGGAGPVRSMPRAKP